MKCWFKWSSVVKLHVGIKHIVCVCVCELAGNLVERPRAWERQLCLMLLPPQVSSGLSMRTGRLVASPLTITGTDLTTVSWRTSCWCRQDEETSRLTSNRQVDASRSHFLALCSVFCVPERLNILDKRLCADVKDTKIICCARMEKNVIYLSSTHSFVFFFPT